VPPQFSWVDHALVQCGLIDRCDARSAALYLFLVTVADAQGLSYYGQRTLAKRLGMSEAELAAARARLVALELVAYEAPLYQVLALPQPQRSVPAPHGAAVTTSTPALRSAAPPAASRGAPAQSIGQLLAALERRRDRL
jgi:hypothetical protein